MRHMLLVLVGLLYAWPARAEEYQIGERTLRVPDGYEIELIAGPPLVDRPISISRDERGRLYATDSAGMSDKADKQLATKPHRIVRMEDSNGDGKYDKSTVFADKMMFPEGCLWYEGSLYVAAPPEIWKLTDTNDDGVADQREVWYDGKTLTGCANDLHGPYLGPDGWFYFCKGAFAEQKHTVHGKPFTTRASHIFRARPDGRDLEPVLTGGMDNPVNVAFLSTGERILSCTFFQFPAAGRRDGLIHAIYGGVYGKKHDSIYEHKQTGDVMPVLVNEGAAAPCGLIAGSDVLFGGGHLDNLFACYFNLHKVVQHELIPNGATFKTVDRDFVACDHPDFHPTDVFEDADGSLIVVDTGGWYKVCCPTSQLAKPDVLGAIYRVKKKGQSKVDDPLGSKIAWSALTDEESVKLLGDQRLFVKRRAIHQLRQTSETPVLYGRLRETRNPTIFRSAAWAFNSPFSKRWAFMIGDTSAQRVAIYKAGLQRDGLFLDHLLPIVTSEDTELARAAAEAVGRICAPVSDHTWIVDADGRRQQKYRSYAAKAIPPLFEAVERLGHFTPDNSGAPSDPSQRIREHSIIYALIEIADSQAVAKEVNSSLIKSRRAALVALDQMDGGTLQPEQVIPLLDHPQPILRNTATWIVGHRPQWGESLVAYFQKRLAQPPMTDAEQTQLAGLLARLAKSPAIQQCIVEQLRGGPNDAARPIALLAMTEAGLTATPASWLDELAQQLPKSEGQLLAQAVAAARQLPLPKGGHAALKAALIDAGRRTDVERALRLDALSIAGALPAVDGDTFQLLVATLGPNEPMAERGTAAVILGSAVLTAEQQLALLDALSQTGPLELPKLLPAFERGPNEALGMKLVAALRESPGLRGLRADLVKALMAKYPATVQEAGQALVTELNASAAEQAAQLDSLLTETNTGDVRRGHEVFLGKKAACINCHTLGYQGGRLGPDLTNIGKARNERDLLEAILYPSVSLVRGYEPVVIELEDGRTLTGIITKESRNEVVLAIDHQKTQHVARKDIADIQPAQVSLMPLGIEKLLTRQELMDLVAFLKTGPK